MTVEAAGMTAGGRKRKPPISALVGGLGALRLGGGYRCRGG